MEEERLSFQESLSNPDKFTITWELVPGRGAFEESQENVLRMAEQAAKDKRINGITITDNPGGRVAISALSMAEDIKKLGIDPIIHFTCKDKNRNGVQSELYALERAGFNNLLVMTGDYPTEGYTGRPKPVFDIDPVHVLKLISNMNDGENMSTPKGNVVLGRTNFFAGAVVSPFKRTEEEQIPQYYKLHKKIESGARFIVSQVGYDPAKFEELRMYMDANNLNVPLIGNIYVLSTPAAKLMNENKIPGCVVTDELLRAIQEEKGKYATAKEGQLLRAAKLYGILKGLKYNGVHIGGHGIKYSDVQYIIEKGEELSRSWQDSAHELLNYHKEGFYYFKKDVKTQMNMPEPTDTGKDKGKFHFSYKLFDLIDYLFFDTKGPLFPIVRTAANVIDKSILKKPFTYFEHVVKFMTNECRSCGDCAMIKRGYICPMSKCPKQQRNGPCGGSFDGWCEVYPGKQKCIYVEAYSRLKSKNKELNLKNDYIPPCNWDLYNTSSWLNYMTGRDFNRVSHMNLKGGVLMPRVKSISRAALEELNKIPGLRINSDIKERRLYDHDVGELPSMPQMLVGNTIPAVIVQPEFVEQIVQVIKWAYKYKIPLVPRAAATSGYGGVIPIKRGAVVELIHFNKILSIDKGNLLASVEPGIVWKDLEASLAREGLAPRMVPTSAPASTVGGWLAQGGGGFGSYKYGWFEENVESASVIYPDGTRKLLKGKELELISGAMGTTGIIISITLKLMAKEEQKVYGIQIKDAQGIEEILTKIEGLKLPFWNIGFINPTAARFKNTVPRKEHHGHKYERLLLPEDYIMLLACFAGDSAEIEKHLVTIAESAGAAMLPDEVVEHEWHERYNPMKVKRIGPSLVPAEVVIPLSRLSEVFEEFDRKIKLPFVIEATVVKGSEVILLGFIPHDVRKLTFNLVFGLSLSVLKIARENRGRAYASGLYLNQEALKIYGQRLTLWKNFKAEKDPGDILNPRKLSGIPLMKMAIMGAGIFEPFVRFGGNLVKPDLKERWKGKRGLLGDIVWYAYACAQCGYCRNVCTLYDGKGWESSSPRGKWWYLRLVSKGKEKFDQEMTDKFLMCTTCERCDFVCQLDLPVEPSWAVMRGELVNTGAHMSFPAFELMAASARKEKNIWANFSKDRDVWVPEDMRPKIKESADIGYFAGCTASFVEKDIGEASIRLLDSAGIEFTYLGKDEACCGIPMLVAGRWDVFEEILRHNIEAMKKRGVKTVVASCPACWLSWNTYYPEWAKKLGIDFDFEVKHYSEIISDKLSKGEMKFTEPVNMKLTFHDSCHIGRAGGVYEPPREMLKALPGVELVEMEHNRENGLCCGSVLTRISEPDPTSNILGKKKIDEAIATGADAVVALCPCCQFQMRVAADVNGQKLPVLDLAAVAAKGLGINLPDSTPYALEMWSVFDKVITLMKVENLAKLMTMLIPNMISAMPKSLQVMMKMAKIPGFAAIMKPMMPKMMPLLMPIIMPKVMPDMLCEVDKMIEMPDFMRQQMPDLMPKTMENMMPHVLPEIARILTPVMIMYIRTGELPDTKIFN